MDNLEKMNLIGRYEGELSILEEVENVLNLPISSDEIIEELGSIVRLTKKYIQEKVMILKGDK